MIGESGISSPHLTRKEVGLAYCTVVIQINGREHYNDQKEVEIMAGKDTVFHIPEGLAKEFAEDLRVVIRHPWVVGIPIPERLKTKLLKGLRGFDAMLTASLAKRAGTPDPIPPGPLPRMEFKIPAVIYKEFGEDLRVIIKQPWPIGIPVPERLRPDMLKGLTNVEVILTPKARG